MKTTILILNKRPGGLYDGFANGHSDILTETVSGVESDEALEYKERMTELAYQNGIQVDFRLTEAQE